MPKAYQTAKPKESRSKGMLAQDTEQKYKEFLDLNEINYAKAERLTRKEDGRVPETFKLEIKDDTEADALITKKFNLSNSRYYL